MQLPRLLYIRTVGTWHQGKKGGNKFIILREEQYACSPVQEETYEWAVVTQAVPASVEAHIVRTRWQPDPQ